MDGERQIDHVVIAVSDLDRVVGQYQALGFTVTPRGYHDWGTMNQLVQFPGANFVELLAIEAAARIPEHALDEIPPRFSFGAHNRDFLARGEGMSMLVLSGNDSRADVAAFAARGLTTYAPFDFTRQARQPDGSEVEVAFSLAFASYSAAPRVGLFTCHNRYPQYFYRPTYQSHANGVAAITAVVTSATEPQPFANVLADFAGGVAVPDGAGYRVGCGPHNLLVLPPDGVAERYPGAGVAQSDETRLVGFMVEGPHLQPRTIPASAAGGAFIVFRESR
ncbi:MAG: VOC family protein [Gammaproteobacteria bacterium]|nr:VOC family protein [Gammaproteobacteria bacterium]